MKTEKQDMHDRKRQDMEDDKDKLLYSELTGVILGCCFNDYTILIILPLTIMHILFFLELI